MTKIVGIRFQQAGKIYYFDPLDYELEVPMHVIVETARGVEMGTVLIPPKEVEDDSVVQPLKPVIRIATDEDEKVTERNRKKEKEAFAICKEKIAKHGLPMKLVSTEYTFDNNKLLFYFTADRRIDFRELVKDLASVFRTRIELRQIGVRDETKMLGGVGICGRELCCKAFLADFIPVSIRMAKEQNLSLNPTKISGVCGRLMCCLKNEQETYEYLNSRLPSVGDTVTTPAGMRGNVQSVNVLRQLVKVVVDNGEEKELQEYRVDDLKFTPRRRRDVKLTEEELRELKELESLEDSAQTVSEQPESSVRGHGSRDSREGRANNRYRGSRRGRGDRENPNANSRYDRDTRENPNTNSRNDRDIRENPNANSRNDRDTRENSNYTNSRNDRSSRENPNYANSRSDRDSRGEDYRGNNRKEYGRNRRNNDRNQPVPEKPTVETQNSGIRPENTAEVKNDGQNNAADRV